MELRVSDRRLGGSIRVTVETPSMAQNSTPFLNVITNPWRCLWLKSPFSLLRVHASGSGVIEINAYILFPQFVQN